MRELVLILIGWGGGLMVGAALIAFLLILDIIPRLVRFSGGQAYIDLYQLLMISGVVLAIICQFYQLQLPTILFFNQLLLIGCGFAFGIFIGLLAGALTETLRVLPVLGRRLNFTTELKIVLAALVLGKTVGSLIYWFFPAAWP